MRWGRVKSGSSRKKKWKHARLQGAQRREGVCVSASVAEGPSASLRTFQVGTSAISGPLEMGRRPKHIYTLTSEVPTRGHPQLSLDQM